MIRAILFDLDGTLVNTLADLADATNTVLRRHGFVTQPLECYRQFVGSGIRKLIERASGTTDPATVDAMLADFVPEYDAGCLRKSRPYDGAEGTLRDLKAAGLKLAVVTNKPEQQAKKIVTHFFGDTFTCIYGGAPDRPKKPDPLIVNLALHELGVSPEEALFIGDSDVDVLTAKNAGLRSIGACWGFRGEAELKTSGADRLAYFFTEIENMY